jgi:hypothetical protein
MPYLQWKGLFQKFQQTSDKMKKVQLFLK